jgi:transcriptional regulator with XRE-family HTH domain
MGPAAARQGGGQVRTSIELEAALGHGIRQRRIAAGLSQVELANVSVGAIHHLERGKGASTKTLTRALAALGAEGWIDQLAPPPPTFNPLNLLESRIREATVTTAPRVRRRSGAPR